jgi:hypothetical protein
MKMATNSLVSKIISNQLWRTAVSRRVATSVVTASLMIGVNFSVYAGSGHESLVGFKSDIQIQTDLFLKYGKPASGGDGPTSPTTSAFTWAGETGSGQITYQVGMFTSPDQGGEMQLTSSDITSPEYMLVCYTEDGPATNQHCPYLSSAQIAPWQGDVETGKVSFSASGFAGGVFHVAVRDKVNKPYDGNGFWWTFNSKIGGKSYLVNKTLSAVLIVPHPTDKDISLTCEFADGKTGPAKIVFEYDNKIVLIYGPDGKVAGVYGIDPTSDLLGWKGWPGKLDPISGGGVTLDRTTGNLQITYPSVFNSPATAGHCAKRSAVRSF